MMLKATPCFQRMIFANMQILKIEKIKVYRFVSEYIGTNMYLIINHGEAVVVDPHPDKDALSLLVKNAVSKVYIFLTHEHPDHTYGIPWLNRLFDTKIVCQQNCAESIQKKH